jgi:TolB-like protein/Tfp pilus assembly protein PilF
VTPGAPYAGQIIHAIDAAKVSVLILSQDAAASPHVLREVERAASKRHPIVALRLDQAPLPADFEYFLNASHWLDTSTRDIGRAPPKLVAAVHVALQTPDATSASTGPTHASAPAVLQRSPKKLAMIVLSVIGLGFVGFAVDRLWLSRHQDSARTPMAPAALAPGSASAASTIPEKSIAVLPFVDMSEKHDQEYFSDGLSEELIEQLTRIPDLRVPARTSSFYFKGKSEDIATIARKLRVAHLLEGSVRKAGNRLRVVAELIRVDSGYHLWSETYDREPNDVFKVQDEIAGAVISELKLKLAAGQQARQSHGTTNTEAYSEYLLARQLADRVDGLDGARHLVEAFRKTIALDPNYVAAYAGLAMAEADAAEWAGDAAAKQQAFAPAEKAVALGPDEADGYAARGYLRALISWDWARALADLEKAVSIDPQNGTVQWTYPEVLASLGRMPEAIAATKKALEVDPLSAYGWSDLGLYFSAERQFAAAHEALRKSLEIQPDSIYGLSNLAVLQLLEGNAAQSLATFRRVSDQGLRLTGIAMAEHTLGHAKESQRALDEAIVKYTRDGAYEIAEVYAWRGENDKAFEWLERAQQSRELDLSKYVKGDPLLRNLEGHARYKAFLRKMNLPQ